MTTRIKCMLSPNGIARAISSLILYPQAKLEPAADELALGVAVDVRAGMAQIAHVQTGDLRNAIMGAPINRAVPCEYEMTVDAFHPDRPNVHYAAVEAGKGGSHDFARNNKALAAESSQVIWESVRTKL